MFIENGVSQKPDISQVVARFFIAKPFYALFFDQPITACEAAIEAPKLLAQLEIAMFTQKIPRRDDA